MSILTIVTTYLFCFGIYLIKNKYIKFSKLNLRKEIFSRDDKEYYIGTSLL